MRIITDSAADFTRDELKALNVVCVPLQVAFGDDTYADGVTLTSDIFWSRLTGGETPKTSQPSPDVFLNAFEEARDSGEEVICVLLSSGLSGTVQSAMLAKSMADYEDIHIVDSLQVTTAQRMLVLRACQLRDEGRLSAEEITAELERFKKRIRLYACLDTLEYLARGGRIPSAAAAVGSMVQLKPLITLNEEGKVAMAGKGMGTHRATASLIKLIQQHEIDLDYEPIPLYTFSSGNCAGMVKKLDAAGIPCSEENMISVGATIGAHAGPGAFGLVFVEKEA